MKSGRILSNKLSPFILTLSLIFGAASITTASTNKSEAGYTLCVNKKTNVVTFLGNKPCPKDASELTLGARGPQGPKGEGGLQGERGDTGSQGPKGFSLLNGIGSPSVLAGDNGDFYLDKSRGELFGPKAENSWGPALSLIGPKGESGAPGAAGAAGPSGATGPAGPAGPSGAPGVSGLSKAYFRLLNSDIFLNSSSSKVVARISDVAAGTYLVFFNTDIMNWGQGQYFGCGFEEQSNGGAGKIWIPEDSLRGGALFESRWNYSKNGVVTVPAPGGVIEVHCIVNQVPSDIFTFYNGSLIALALDHVTSSVRTWPNP